MIIGFITHATPTVLMDFIANSFFKNRLMIEVFPTELEPSKTILKLSFLHN